MRIDIITLHPAIIEEVFKHSMMKRAQQKKIAEIYLHNLREFGFGKHQQADDYAFGGGAGMVMMIEPIDNCIEKLDSFLDEKIITKINKHHEKASKIKFEFYTKNSENNSEYLYGQKLTNQEKTLIKKFNYKET